jgi:hypothetical protein
MRATQHVRMVLGALGVSTLSLIPLDGRAETSGINRKCEVFSSARDKARRACALEQGGWVTEVQGKWQRRCRLEQPRDPRSLSLFRRVVRAALPKIAIENGGPNLKQKMGVPDRLKLGTPMALFSLYNTLVLKRTLAAATSYHGIEASSHRKRDDRSMRSIIWAAACIVSG